MPDYDEDEDFLEDELAEERAFVPKEMITSASHFTECELDGDLV